MYSEFKYIFIFLKLNNYTSNDRITFQSEDYVLLEIPELSGLIDGIHYNSQDDFAKILLDSAQNKTTFYNNLLVYPIIKRFHPTIDISKLTINFKIFGNNFYDFHICFFYLIICEYVNLHV